MYVHNMRVPNDLNMFIDSATMLPPYLAKGLPPFLFEGISKQSKFDIDANLTDIMDGR